MLDLKNILENKVIIRKSNHSTKWQVRGSEICRKIGSKNYSAIIRLYKLYPNVVERAYNFVADYFEPRSKEKLFFWAFKKFRNEKN